MKIVLYYSLLLACFLFGCGSDTNSYSTNDQVALRIIQKYDFQTEGQPQTYEFKLPQELTDANWGLKKLFCEEAGYNLNPYAGQNVSAMRYSILERCNHYDEPLYLWILIKDNSCICAYASVREGSGLAPGIFVVNDPCIQ